MSVTKQDLIREQSLHAETRAALDAARDALAKAQDEAKAAAVLRAENERLARSLTAEQSKPAVVDDSAVRDLTAALGKAKARARAAETDLDAMREKHQRAAAQWAHEKQAMQRDLDQSEAARKEHRAALAAEVAAAKAAVAVAEDAAKAATHRALTAEREAAKLRADLAKRPPESAHGKIAKLERKIADLDADLAAARTTARDLQAALTAAPSADEFNAMRDEVARLRAMPAPEPIRVEVVKSVPVARPEDAACIAALEAEVDLLKREAAAK